MSVRIIKYFEMIHIEHDDGKRPAGARGAVHFALERFFQIAAIE